MNATQTEFQQANGGASQADRILERLQKTPDVEIPMPHLARIGSGKPDGFCMVHSRIADLRKRGYVIEQRNERRDGVVQSYYRLIAEPLT